MVTSLYWVIATYSGVESPKSRPRGKKEGRKDGLTEIPFLELSPETGAEGRAVAGSATRSLRSKCSLM